MQRTHAHKPAQSASTQGFRYITRGHNVAQRHCPWRFTHNQSMAAESEKTCMRVSRDTHALCIGLDGRRYACRVCSGSFRHALARSGILSPTVHVNTAWAFLPYCCVWKVFNCIFGLLACVKHLGAAEYCVCFAIS